MTRPARILGLRGLCDVRKGGGGKPTALRAPGGKWKAVER